MVCGSHIVEKLAYKTGTNTPDIVIFKGTTRIINVSLLELDLSTPMDIAVLVFTASGSPAGAPARTLSQVSLLLYLTAVPVWPSFLAVEIADCVSKA